jgi:hypothetical protein
VSLVVLGALREAALRRVERRIENALDA